MNKGQGTLFNFGVKKSRIEGVCDATDNNSSKMYKRRGKLPAHRRKSLHSLVSTWTAI